MTWRTALASIPIVLLAALVACSEDSEKSATTPGATATKSAAESATTAPASLPRGLLIALSQFEVGLDGKVLPKPGPAKLEILVRQGGEWKELPPLIDPDSNVFHKAMVYEAPDGPTIATFSGMKAAVKLWRRGQQGYTAETLWTKDFGGKFSRMREAEIGDVLGDGRIGFAVATHDQGVIATIVPKPGAASMPPGPDRWEVKEIDREKDTFGHEIEFGDLDGDGVVEFYATLSEPNRLDGRDQSGRVMRYLPAKGERAEVANLGDRHAKEILVGDVDGDGRDELYVSVEAKTEAFGQDVRIVEPVEIRRYDAGTDPGARNVIAKLDDRLCRFLTAGDVDGDGRKEIVAAGFKSGLWLLRPGAAPNGEWQVQSIDRNSSGFEHTALLTDLDGDGTDELYVASDDQGELRRYVWRDGRFEKEVIHTRTPAGSAFTWNLMPVPVDLVR